MAFEVWLLEMMRIAVGGVEVYSSKEMRMCAVQSPKLECGYYNKGTPTQSM